MRGWNAYIKNNNRESEMPSSQRKFESRQGGARIISTGVGICRDQAWICHAPHTNDALIAADLYFGNGQAAQESARSEMYTPAFSAL